MLVCVLKEITGHYLSWWSQVCTVLPELLLQSLSQLTQQETVV